MASAWKSAAGAASARDAIPPLLAAPLATNGYLPAPRARPPPANCRMRADGCAAAGPAPNIEAPCLVADRPAPTGKMRYAAQPPRRSFVLHRTSEYSHPSCSCGQRGQLGNPTARLGPLSHRNTRKTHAILTKPCAARPMLLACGRSWRCRQWFPARAAAQLWNGRREPPLIRHASQAENVRWQVAQQPKPPCRLSGTEKAGTFRASGRSNSPASSMRFRPDATGCLKQNTMATGASRRSPANKCASIPEREMTGRPSSRPSSRRSRG